MANKKDPAENRQDLLQIGILSLWVQYSTRNMGLPSAKRKSDKTQIGLFIGGEVFHFGGDYDIIKTKICTNKSVQCVEKRCLSLNVGVDNVSRRCKQRKGRICRKHKQDFAFVETDDIFDVSDTP